MMTHNEIPAWIVLPSNKVWRCQRCGAEVNANFRPSVEVGPFIEKHSRCVARCGDGPASSLTVREHFAAQALAGILAHQGKDSEADYDTAASHAARAAEALCRALGR